MNPNPHVVLLKSKLGAAGGLEKASLGIVQAFIQRGCPVTLLTTGEPSPSLPPQCRVVSLGANLALSLLQIKAFDRACRSWLQTHPAPIVFGLDRNSFQTHYRAGNGVHAHYLTLRKKQESWWKGVSFDWNPLHRTLLSLERQTYEGHALRRLFTNSRMVKEEALRYYRIPEEKIVPIHNGVEWEEMAGDFSAWESQKPFIISDLGLDSSCYQFLFVGHGFRRKGLEPLLRGLSELKDPWQLSVVGRDKHARQFQTLAERLGIRERVFFFGERRDTRRFFQMADALAIPSLYDPFANVTVEALAMGLFVISSPSNGGSEVLTPQSGVTITDMADPEAMKEALTLAFKFPKTPERASAIRQTVKGLEFLSQLDRIVDLTLNA